MPRHLQPTIRQLQPLGDTATGRRRARPPRTSAIRFIAALATLLVLAAGIGVASGAIPSGGGRIHACFEKSGGELRVIDKAKQQQCKTGEQALEWNQQGPKGDPGPQGPKGDPGAGGLGRLTPRNASQTLAAGQTDQIDALCQPGERATGGGYLLFGNDPDLRVLTSNPDLDLTKWSVEVANDTARPQDVIAQVVCAS